MTPLNEVVKADDPESIPLGPRRLHTCTSNLRRVGILAELLHCALKQRSSTW